MPRRWPRGNAYRRSWSKLKEEEDQTRAQQMHGWWAPGRFKEQQATSTLEQREPREKGGGAVSWHVSSQDLWGRRGGTLAVTGLSACLTQAEGWAKRKDPQQRKASKAPHRPAASQAGIVSTSFCCCSEHLRPVDAQRKEVCLADI